MTGENYPLPATAARHVAQALRMRIGDPVALFTGTGGEFEATITRIDRHRVVVSVARHAPIERETSSPVTLVAAIIAADMMDFVVRKAVELGVAAIVPIQAARSQKLPADRAARRVLHWRKIAIAACEQCGRNRVPDVAPITTFSEWLAVAGTWARPVAILDADAAQSLAAHAAAARPGTIAAGPEGGFASEELQRAMEQGALPAHLGPRVLRAETAALAALATINAVAGDAR